jgi:cephalosporin hydroxylase
VPRIEAGVTIDPKTSRRKVIGIDFDIRAHNRQTIETHPMSSRIQMIQGSSITSDVVDHVRKVANDYNCVMVCLDSYYTYDHVLAEIESYAALASIGSYCMVFCAVVDDMPAETFPDRPWGPGNNPKIAVQDYLKTHPEFQIDKAINKNC